MVNQKCSPSLRSEYTHKCLGTMRNSKNGKSVPKSVGRDKRVFGIKASLNVIKFLTTNQFAWGSFDGRMSPEVELGIGCVQK